MLTQLLREHPEVRHELQRLMREVFPGYDGLKFQRKTVFAEAKPGQPRAQDVGLVRT
jgi:hypothetical protein